VKSTSPGPARYTPPTCAIVGCEKEGLHWRRTLGYNQPFCDEHEGDWSKPPEHTHTYTQGGVY